MSDDETTTSEQAQEADPEVDEDVLLLDEKDELYGYAVLNIHEGCFVSLPEADHGLSTRGYSATPDHITRAESEELITQVAEHHGLLEVSHLRVVQVRLDNQLDKEASDHFDNEKEKQPA